MSELTAKNVPIGYCTDTKRGLYEDCPGCTTLRARVAAQLSELHAISDAIGTNEGHSSVDHIKDLRAEVERLRGLCKEIASFGQTQDRNMAVSNIRLPWPLIRKIDEAAQREGGE